MSLFGCKHICALRRLIAAVATILLIPSMGAIASPITSAPDADRAGLSIPQVKDEVPRDLSVAPEAPAILPGDLDIRTDQPSLADLLGDSAAPPLAPTRADLRTNRPLRGESTQPGDETLRQVLRALVTRHSFDSMMALPSNFDSSTEAPPTTPSEGRRPAPSGSRLLDNRAAGRVLREFVDVQSETDRDVIFSVLGMGKFVLEKSGRSGTVTLSELSSGWSATLLPAYDANNINGGRSSPSPVSDGGGSLLLSIVRWTLDFVTNPLGIVLLMIAGVIAFLAGVVRLTVFMRNQAALKRRSRRRRRQRSSRSAAARSKTGPATR